MKLSKEQLILLVLRTGPVKGSTLQSILFFLWKRLGSKPDWIFKFKPTGYGPAAIGYGDIIYQLARENLVLESTSPPGRGGTSRLTENGKCEADKIAASIETIVLNTIEDVVLETAKLSNSELVSKLVLEAPALFYPPLAPINVRKEAMEILKSDQQNKFEEASKLLGHNDDNEIMSYYQMASMLGVTNDHLKYLVSKEWRSKEAKQVREAKILVQGILGETITSTILGFEIWLPKNWKVTGENTDIKNLGEEIQIQYDRWAKLSEDRKLKMIPDFSLPRLPIENIPAELFDRDTNTQVVFMEWNLKEMLRLKRKQGMQVGSWIADPCQNNENETIWIEVVKFGLRETMTSEELYYAEKPSEQSICGSSRPAARKDLVIDDMHAVKAYYEFLDPKDSKLPIVPALFVTYLTDGLIGWAIHCWCEPNETSKLRPLFHRVVSSFRRIK